MKEKELITMDTNIIMLSLRSKHEDFKEEKKEESRKIT